MGARLVITRTAQKRRVGIPDRRAMGRAGESLKLSVGDTPIGFHMDMVSKHRLGGFRLGFLHPRVDTNRQNACQGAFRHPPSFASICLRVGILFILTILSKLFGPGKCRFSPFATFAAFA